MKRTLLSMMIAILVVALCLSLFACGEIKLNVTTSDTTLESDQETEDSVATDQGEAVNDEQSTLDEVANDPVGDDQHQTDTDTGDDTVSDGEQTTEQTEGGAQEGTDGSTQNTDGDESQTDDSQPVDSEDNTGTDDNTDAGEDTQTSESVDDGTDDQNTDGNDGNNDQNDGNNDQTTDGNTDDDTEQTGDGNADDEQTVATGKSVAFAHDESVTVTVYPTQATTDGEVTDEALSRDGDTGDVVDEDGQVNFALTFADGYELDSITVTPQDGFKNCKDLGSGLYRITKISEELTVTITAKAIETSGEDDTQEGGTENLTSYTVETTLDGEELTLTLTATAGTFTADYTDGVLTVDVTSEGEMELAFSGGFAGGIVVTDSEQSDTTQDLTLAFVNLTLTSDSACPLYIDTDCDVDISVKSGTLNAITDKRQAVDEEGISAAVYATSDLTLKGKGTLTVYSAYNNGVHTKDDLTVKNLTLTVNCLDNALKGNDSVTVESGTLTLIARQGDGIKTSNSSLSSTGKQKGTITILGGTIDVYAACDGLDASYDVVIEDGTLNVYTDCYSDYSEEVTATADGVYYIRSTTTSYKYSVYYYNADGEGEWVNSASYEAVTSRSGRSNTTYYYYEVAKKSGYTNMYVYVYTSAQTQGQSATYYAKSSNLTLNDSYDSLALSVSSGTARVSWTNKTTQSSTGGFGPGGMGGMQDGNSDKGDYSTKGIKADNAITISGGTVNITAYDDAIHANNDNALETGVTPTGDVTISGGVVTVSSNDDGIHADGALVISGGNVTVTKSYEGLEGNTVTITDGTISVTSSDDGINACATSGVGLQIDGGYLYVYAGGDGLDANSTTQYKGIVFNGGRVVVISTSGGNSCIDTEQGYTYNGGYVIAMCPTGMQQEAYNCQTSLKKYTTMSLSGYVTVSGVGVVKMPKSISSGFVICLGTSSTSFSTSTSSAYTVDSNGVYWMV